MNKIKAIQTILAVFLLSICSALAATDLSSASPEGAEVYFVSPQDGDTVDPTFTVIFGLSGMGIAPAGVEMEHTGHHHLLVNVAELPPAGQPLSADVMHFGKGQTQAELTLEPGQHTLQLVLGNHLHVPHTPPVMSEKITITVK